MSVGVRRAGRVVAVISPADRLLGRGIALELAERRFDVALIGEDETILREIALAVLHVGGRVLAVKAGTGGSDTVSAGIHEICDRLGPIEVWVALDAECSTVDGSNSRGSACRQLRGPEIFGWGLLDAVAVMSERHCGTVISVDSTMAFIPLATRTGAVRRFLRSAWVACVAATRGAHERWRRAVLLGLCEPSRIGIR